MKMSLSISACALMALAGAANANTSAFLTNVSPGENLTVTFDGNDGSKTSWDSNAYVGQINWIDATSTVSSAIPASFSSYCIEGTQSVKIDKTNTWANVLSVAQSPEPGAGMGAAKATDIENFWAEYSGKVDNNQTAAAFQLGIWKIVSDASTTTAGTINSTLTSFSKGEFRVTSSELSNSAVTLASSWLSGLTISATNDPTLLVLSDPINQDQLMNIHPTGASLPPATPLPAAVTSGLVTLGLLAAGMKLRRKLAV
jgi:hypothetical protein